MVNKPIKPGRVIVMLAGRMAGKKAVVLSTHENGTKNRPFAHALVAGVARPPKRVGRRMTEKKIQKRTRVRAFVRFVNYTHLQPTRYLVTNDIDCKQLLTEMDFTDADKKKESRKKIKEVFQEKFVPKNYTGEVKISKDIVFLRQKLRF